VEQILTRTVEPEGVRQCAGPDEEVVGEVMDRLGLDAVIVDHDRAR
jgi:hypothetical protein